LIFWPAQLFDPLMLLDDPLSVPLVLLPDVPLVLPLPDIPDDEPEKILLRPDGVPVTSMRWPTMLLRSEVLPTSSTLFAGFGVEDCSPDMPLWPDVLLPEPLVLLPEPLVLLPLPDVPLVLEPLPDWLDDMSPPSVTFVRMYPLPLGSAWRQPVSLTASPVLLEYAPLIDPVWPLWPLCEPVVD
jgi:hypothetical protein